jgi:hypothetical protein
MTQLEQLRQKRAEILAIDRTHLQTQQQFQIQESWSKAPLRCQIARE